MNKKFFLLITIILLSISVVSVASERIPVKYIKTSDGDTARFEVNGENVRVRFLGINTPEVAGEDKVEEPYGNEALEYTKNRLDNAKEFEIEYDENADKEDRFGRILAYIWVDGELFQEELVRKGYAKTYMMKSNYKYADELKSAERKAKEEKLGVWNVETVININKDEDVIEENNPAGGNEITDTEIIQFENKASSTSYVVIILILIALIAYFMKKYLSNK